MSNCTRTSVGSIPIFDGEKRYDESNEMPASHRQAGEALLAQIEPDGEGKYTFAGFGMSNAYRKVKTAIQLWSNNAAMNHLRRFNCCKGGYDAEAMTKTDYGNPKNYWTLAYGQLGGLPPSAVQTGWLETALSKPNGITVEKYVDDLAGYMITVLQIMRSRFPGLKMLWLSDRSYAGYASSQTNPEPYAWATGQAVKRVVLLQIAGDPRLSYPDLAPWIAWGPSLWADGLTARSDGLTWQCSDFIADGIHPSVAGRKKVFHQLLDPFFSAEPLTAKWYLGQ